MIPWFFVPVAASLLLLPARPRSIEEEIRGQGRGVPPSVQIADLIEQLGDNSFARREEAGKKLIGFGPAARVKFQDASRSHSDLEVRVRSEGILRKIRKVVVRRKGPEPPSL